MINFLKKYEGKTFTELVNGLIWFDLPLRLKAIFSKLPSEDSRPYKVYTALLTQTGTNAPVATVLENTLGGDIVWTRDSAGYYIGTLTGEFLLNKTFISNSFVELNQFEDKVYMYRENDNVIALRSYLGGTQDDGLINHFPIEIRVYN